MKRYFAIIVAIMTLHNVSVAQNRVGAKVNVLDFEYKADSVKIGIEFDLEDLKIGNNESVVFSPKIFKEQSDKSLDLPTLVVKNRGGARLYKRAMVLGNEKSLNRYEQWYGTPHKVIEHYGSERQDRVIYDLTIPYEKWMVESELYVDCTTCGCCKSEDSGIVIPDENMLLIDIPIVAPYVIRPQVELIKPEKVAIKRRDIEYSSALIFKVNSTYIDPNLEGNRAELNSIDEMMQSVISDSDYTITEVNIVGFASPEGTLASNMRLSEGRAAALESRMKREYTTIAPELYSVKFGGENWEKLYEIVSQGDDPWREDVLNIIDNYSIEEGRETKLMALNGGAPYRYLLKNVFPATRLVVVSVDFNVDAYDIVRIGELIDTKPENLSLEEMYRLSENYTIEDTEFEKIFMTAVAIYPNDEVAQNNALVTEIRKGEVESIEEIAEGVDKQTSSAELANSLGVYYMLSCDYDQARSMLQRAIRLGSQRAEENMKQLTAKFENLRQIKESEEFRAKIYGE